MRTKSIIRGYKSLSTNPVETARAGVEAAIATYLDGVRASGHPYVVVQIQVEIYKQPGTS